MLYHVTFAEHVDSISSTGLKPGHGKNFWNFPFYAKGKAFFTTYEGLPCWFEKIETVGQDRYKERAVIKGAFPVVMRLRDEAIERILDDLEEDLEGDRDCPDGESFSVLLPYLLVG